MVDNFLAKDRNRILIVGGGYVGFTVAQQLQKRIKASGGIVTVVDPNPYMMYLPFLPEVAAGSIEARSAVVSHQQYLSDCELVSGRVTGINHAERVATVQTIADGPVLEIPYDEIVVAGGSVTRAFPIEGLPPSLAEPPRLCPFLPRCAVAVPACQETMPPMRQMDSLHAAACHADLRAHWKAEAA